MARTVDVLVERLKTWLPPGYAGAEPLLAAFAATLRQAELAIDELVPLVTIGGGEGAWLTLQARGYGVVRSTDESDASVRNRVRNIEDALTGPKLLDAIERIQTAHGVAPSARLIEWFDEPYLDFDEDAVEGSGGFYLGSAHASGGRNSFIVVVPLVGSGFAVGPYADADWWLDATYLGLDEEHPVYGAIVAEVERLRAAGVSWRLVLDT